MSEKTISASELRANLPKVLKLISKPGQSIIITLRGKPEAIIMGIEEYEGWLETMDIMADKELMKSLSKSLNEIKKGDKDKNWKEVRSEIEYYKK